MALTDDIKGLGDGNTGNQHGGELAGKDGDVLGPDLLLDLEQGFRVLGHLKRVNTLPAQRGLHKGDTRGLHLAFDFLALFIDPFPGEGIEFWLSCGCCGHIY